jgi:hypothetical protein
MLRNRVLYSPAVIKRFSEQILHEARKLQRARQDLTRIREDFLLEAQAIREEMHAARRELARLQALDAAQRAERDLFAPLH